MNGGYTLRMTEPGAVEDAAVSAAESRAESGAERDQRDPEAVSRFVESFAAQLVAGGMQRMSARVFAALLSSDAGALTAAELGEQLQVSPAAVSGAVRYLSQTHMVSREREPGSRRERYRVYSDQWYEALTSSDAILKRWEQTLRVGVESLGVESPGGRRIAETLAFFEYMEGELAQLMNRWREERVRIFGQG